MLTGRSTSKTAATNCGCGLSIRPGCSICARSGELKPFGIAPVHYFERIDVANRELSVDFDWSRRIVRFAGRGAGEPVSFEDGTQDPLSLQFHLPLLAQAYPWRFTPGALLTFQVARRKVESYTFAVDGFEPMTIHGRVLHTLKIVRPKTPESNRGVEVLARARFRLDPRTAPLCRYQQRSVGQRACAPAGHGAAVRADSAGGGQALGPLNTAVSTGMREVPSTPSMSISVICADSCMPRPKSSPSTASIDAQARFRSLRAVRVHRPFQRGFETSGKRMADVAVAGDAQFNETRLARQRRQALGLVCRIAA